MSDITEPKTEEIKPIEPVKVPEEKTEVKEEIKEETPIKDVIPQDNWQTSPLFYELANFLGVEAKDYENVADKISVITDYATEMGKSAKIEDLFHNIRQLEDKLQPPAWGENRVNHLYKFLRLESQWSAAKKALSSFTRSGKWE